MGDRVSISFVKDDWESPTLFSHWGGIEFVEYALQYAIDLVKRKKGTTVTPLDRLEPQTVLVDFIRHITKNEKEINSDLYLGRDFNDGDNSDNGHYQIILPDKEKYPNAIKVELKKVE